jgi:hypothetical protein
MILKALVHQHGVCNVLNLTIPFSHLLQDDKALLDELDLFSVADNLLVMNDDLAGVRAIEVV